MEDDIVKVHGACIPQTLLVGGVQPGDRLRPEVTAAAGGLFEVGGQLHFVLGPGDGSQHGLGGELLIVNGQLLQAVLHDPDGIVGVIDGEGGGKSQLFAVPAEDAHAGGVEGGGPDVPGGGAQHLFQTVLQLAGGLVGEGDGDDGPGGGGLQRAQPVRPQLLLPGGSGHEASQKFHIPGSDPVGHLGRVGTPAVADEVGHPVDEHRGLAGACARQQQQGAFGGQSGFLLFAVQGSVVEGDGLPPQAAEVQLLFVCQHGIRSLSTVLKQLYHKKLEKYRASGPC